METKMDRFDAMALLVQVAEAGSLSAAGRRLGLPLTTVSRRIADLEAHLGARLLVRSNRRAELTEAGAAYLQSARRILAEVVEAEATASGAFRSVRGEVTVTAPLVFGRLHVLPLVTDFLRAWPEVEVRLILSDRNAHLADDHVDLAVRIGQLPDSSLKALKVGAVQRVTVASPAYLAASGMPVVPADLTQHSCIAFSGLGLPDRWEFRAETVAIRPRLTVSTAEAALDAAEAGLGVTRVLSYQTAGRALDLLLDAFAPDPVPVSLVHADQGAPPMKLRALVDTLGPGLKAALSGTPRSLPLADAISGSGRVTSA
jgi:DNA-binding transcriptional LysR family regulator